MMGSGHRERSLQAGGTASVPDNETRAAAADTVSVGRGLQSHWGMVWGAAGEVETRQGLARAGLRRRAKSHSEGQSTEGDWW